MQTYTGPTQTTHHHQVLASECNQLLGFRVQATPGQHTETWMRAFMAWEESVSGWLWLVIILLTDIFYHLIYHLTYQLFHRLCHQLIHHLIHHLPPDLQAFPQSTWEVPEEHLKNIWRTSEEHLRNTWETPEKHWQSQTLHPIKQVQSSKSLNRPWIKKSWKGEEFNKVEQIFRTRA